MCDDREILEDSQWERLFPILKANGRVYIGNQEACRQFVRAVFWVLFTGSQWKLVPKEYGRANTIYKRFTRWGSHGVWSDLYERFGADPELQTILYKAHMITCYQSNNRRELLALSRRLAVLPEPSQNSAFSDRDARCFR
ncbi:transposase [Pseudomonas batumici]|uniref:transposase n=1 Tax=Pseudomonas batumici TaxID=226910 RepID=UPI0030D0864F